MTLISCCINADTRQGYKNESSAVGDYGQGSLQGVRSSDFLIEGVKNKVYLCFWEVRINPSYSSPRNKPLLL